MSDGRCHGPPGFAMRVLLIGPLPPPAGGMANQTRQLADRLREAGHDVTLLRSNADYVPRWVGHIPVLRAVFRLIPYVFRLWQATGRAELLHVMANSGWSWHLFAAPAVLIGRLRGRGVLVNYRGGGAAQFLRRQAWCVLPVLRRAVLVAVPSAYLVEVFKAYGLTAVELPNVVDLQRFRAVAAACRGDLQERPQFLVARNLERIYDLPTAITAFALIQRRVPGAGLVIAGAGPERPALEALVQRLGLREQVAFTGRLDPDQMARCYARSHFLLNASTVDNAPNVILEAWASGAVVVSTAAGGIPYLVEADRNAVLVPVRDPAALAQAALALIADPDRWSALREAGLQTAGRFAWEAVYPLWAQAYARVAAAHWAKARMTGNPS